ncbi:MAG: hypothetical protein A2Z14_03975 [Chloroflexi bacterium RBG_16_48_8]|nr:MAG: hypothetical protein A2Z14_03975 [Chloroflexi bacterium RBG_16_48_8]
MLCIVTRDLKDAAVPGLSSDRCFFIAYEAGLTLATIPLYCYGYETHGRGHHWMTFLVLPEVMGSDIFELADYFELCRTKRNVGTYDRGGQISQSEVEELINEVKQFQFMVEEWLRINHPHFV